MTQREMGLEALDKVLAKWGKMTPHEMTQMLIERGLIDTKGKLLPQNKSRAGEDENKGGDQP